MSPTRTSHPEHQQRGVPPPPPPPPAKITSLDAIVGVGITVGALFFLLLMAVITPKIIRHRREVLTRKRREELEVSEKRRARVGSGSGGSGTGSGSGGEKGGISRAGSEVSRDTVEGKEEAVERGRSRVPRPLPA
ncbi:hypothetical protein TWF788_003470 [Orbilia oligospora]|uniref:Transmembrane protein n=1 Tax=Orbilia oligospora TaxID=2813651 RepID=A0A7C8K2A8_ORBOL|nr:hypothetical protein TWF788_003470 [Orbilia oligospora]